MQAAGEPTVEPGYPNEKIEGQQATSLRHETAAGKRRRVRIWFAYVLAAVLIPLTIYIRVVLVDASDRGPGISLLLIPITLCSYLGGLGPGVFATILAAIGSDYFLLQPLHSFSIDTRIQSLQWISLVVEGTLISILGESNRRKAFKSGLPAKVWKSAEKKVRWSFGIALGALVLVGAFSFFSVQRFREDARAVDHTHQVISSLRQLVSNLAIAESGQRGYVITGDSQYADPYLFSFPILDSDLNELRLLTLENSAQQSRLTELAPLIESRRQLLQKIFEIRKVAGFEEARQAIMENDSSGVDLEIQAKVTEMETEENNLLRERVKKARESNLEATTTILMGSTLAVGFLAVALFAIGRDFAGARRAEKQLLEAQIFLEERVQERTGELARAMTSLKFGEERLERIISSALDAIITVDESQCVTIFNPAAVKMFGCSAESAMCAPLSRFIPDRFRDRHREHVREFAEGGSRGQKMGEYRTIYGLRKDGTEFPIEASISQIEVSGQRFFTVILRDLTDIAQAHESRAKLASIVESSDDAIISKTLDGVVTSWNHGAERIFGYASEEMVGKPMLKLFPAGLENEETTILERIRAGESIRHFESVRLRKDGHLIDVSVTISPIRGSDGQIVGVSKVARDISAQKRAESALRDSERRARRFIEEAPICVAMLDREMRYLAASRRWTEIYGRGRQELTGISHYELQPDIPEYWKQAHRRGLQGEVIRNDEDCWLQPDGTERWLRWALHPWREESGAIGGIVMTAEDITQQKKDQDTLKWQASLFDQSYDAVAVWEWNGAIKFWNRGAERTYGFSREESVGRISHDLLKTKADTGFDELLAILEKEKIWEGVLKHTTRSGKQIFVEARMLLIREGERHYVLETCRDISEKLQLEQQLRQSQKMEGIGRLAGGVAHDFNNLLGVILGCSELLEEANDLKKVHGRAEEIRKAAERAANLTRQLLAFSRKQMLEPRVVDLTEIVSDMMKMLPRLVGEDVLFHTNLAPDLGKVKIDPGQIEQVLLNLVVNARDAMPQGGQITIETQNFEMTGEYAESHADVEPGPFAVVTISDSGEGMTAETQSHIFEPFFTTKHQGTGLGLATVYGVVRQSGGHIWVYSEIGRGTTFKLYFPRVDAAPEESAPPRLPEIIVRASETILLVEDSESLRHVAREFLELAGYQVLEAVDGKDAVRIAASHPLPVHLLLTDVVMPAMSGTEVAKQVCQHHPEAKVLYMSGYTADAIVHHGVLDEGLALLTKPFSRASLTQKVREVLNAKQTTMS